MASRPHGLATYAPILLEAGFDLQSLCDITADDLGKLDIPPSEQKNILSMLTWEPGSTQARVSAASLARSVLTAQSHTKSPPGQISHKVTPPPMPPTAWTEEQTPPARATTSLTSLRRSANADSEKRSTKHTASSGFSLFHWFENFVEDSLAIGQVGAEKKSVFWTAALIIIPLLCYCRAMGYKWASNNDTPKFSKFLPPMFGACLVAGLGSAFVLVKYGVAATRRLLQKRYLLVAIIGILRGTLVACENIALTYVDALVFAVTMKFAIVPCLCMEAVAIRKCPADALQLLTIANSLMGICLYLVSSASDGAELSILGIVFCIFGSLADALGDVSMGYVSGRLLARTEDVVAEKVRILIAMEVSEALTLMVVALSFETDLLFDKGMLYGWDYKVVVGACLANGAKRAAFNVMIMINGALPTNLAACFDITVTYIFDTLVFKTKDFGTTAMLLAMITFAIVAYFIHMILLVRERKVVVEEVRHSLSRRFSQDSMGLTRRMSSQNIGRRASQNSINVDIDIIKEK
jgi:hypothetical protein